MNTTGITKDLNKSEEVVLVKIALNPNHTGEQLKDELETDVDSFSDCVDTLISRGYVELRTSDSEENNWQVTKLGRLALKKFATVLDYDLRYAEEIGEDDAIKRKLKKEKMMFKRALNACLERMDGVEQRY